LKKNIEVSVGYHLPHLPNNSKSHRIVKRLLGSNSLSDGKIGHFWPDHFYKLDKSSLYNALPNDIQIKVLEILANESVIESFAIEQSGMAFAAKMNLLSESVEERIMYSVFSSQEARHYYQLSQFCGSSDVSVAVQHPFFKLLIHIIESGTRLALQCIVQIILEGWGMFHYKGLADSCLDLNLKKILMDILADEADHHGSGVLFFDSNLLSSHETKFIYDAVKELIYLVRIGPQSILATLESQCDGIAKNQRIKFLNDVEAFATTQKKLNILKHLVTTSGFFPLKEELEKNDFFVPLSVYQMSKLKI